MEFGGSLTVIKRLFVRFFLRRKLRIGKHCKFGGRVKFIFFRNKGFISIGDNTEIFHGCMMMPFNGCIIIGNDCSINPYTLIYGHGKGVIIGNNVLIAGHCMIIPSNHIFSDKNRPIRCQSEHSKGIIIEDDVWIAAGCKILDGVTISKGSIIAAGSVVTKNTIPYSINGGVPSAFIKMRGEE